MEPKIHEHLRVMDSGEWALLGDRQKRRALRPSPKDNKLLISHICKGSTWVMTNRCLLHVLCTTEGFRSQFLLLFWIGDQKVTCKPQATAGKECLTAFASEDTSQWNTKSGQITASQSTGLSTSRAVLTYAWDCRLLAVVDRPGDPLTPDTPDERPR